ncbi:MAG: hypothetical protein IJD89_00475 [Clostridia bacterium]|nr:hypothetical protein [Clostridia bacterium]
MNTIEGKTLEQILGELKVVVDNHNKSDVASERVKLEVQAAKLKDDYNKTSKQTAYAECLEAENPMLTFIQKYKFPVVSLGTNKDTKNITVKTEDSNGVKLTEVFNLWDFVAWCEERNKQVTVALDWKSKAIKAKNALIAVIEADNNTGVYSIGEFKAALQTAFDSIVKVAGESGNNAVIAKSKQCRIIKNTAGRLDNRSFVAQFGSEKAWQKQVFAYLHLAIEGKEFTTIYGDGEENATTTEETKDETKK